MSNNMILPVGTELHGYTILKKLGKGGFGITYLVEKEGKEYVLKELFVKDICFRSADGRIAIHDDAAMQDTFSFLFDRFKDEADILMQIDHIAIVKVTEYFVANNTGYYAMEYLEGESLEDYIKRVGPQDKETTIKLLFPILEAVKEMHNKGLWHRDIKPDNIMICANRTVLIDFGAVKVTDKELFSLDRKHSILAMTTPAYAAPEQSSNLNQNVEIDHCIDIYALGGTLYYMLVGEKPYSSSESRLNLDVKHGSRHLEDMLIQHSLDPVCRKSISKSMAWLKEHRVQSVNELQTILVECTKSESTIPDPNENKIPVNSGFLENNWYLMLPMIVSAGIALVLFFIGESIGGIIAMILSIGLGVTIGIRSNASSSPVQYTTQFKLLDIQQGTESYINAHQSYMVGRKASCDIIVSPIHKSVSREHLLLTCSSSHIAVRELKETQGTYINGIKLTPYHDYPWEAGDELILVDTDCTFKWEYA